MVQNGKADSRLQSICMLTLTIDSICITNNSAGEKKANPIVIEK